MLVLCLAAPVSVFAAPGDTRLHQDSASYRVYLGVTPAKLIEQQPQLVDRDKAMHGGLDRAPDAQHVTLSIHDIKTNAVVTDLTVIAGLRHRKWTHRQQVERPLERMRVGGVVTYGNYFRMPEHGEYEIDIRIYTTSGDGAETVRFMYKKPE